MKNTLQQFGKQAFSLVEVTLALGVVAYALLALLGLLAVGISSSKESHRETVMAQIVSDALAIYNGMADETLNYTFEGKRTATPADVFFRVELTAVSGETLVDGTSEKLRWIKISISSPREPSLQKIIRASLFIP